ncbi:hypothetical protein P280DRAFT_549491 [Massarina eburnea CBS 473.64]|uniref:C2H2-type domain-containing protein n=1 Tax=Massarina eburnea CBS 473.64 TaxID=1395130 RepID=A0A6A6RZZ9_9PLEO|nr:hypothetical protein P280DRAFT_549491 [Massarina eburnea CBS 473.64]
MDDCGLQFASRRDGAPPPPTLPKLRTVQGVSSSASHPLRRDSLSSSRTGDSGYNSDPDVSLSPLEFVAPLEQLPYTSSNFIFDSSALLEVKEVASYKSRGLFTGNSTNSTFLKKHKNLQKTLLAPKFEITRCPTSCPQADVAKPARDWTGAFKDGTKSTSTSDGRHENVECWITENLRPQGRSEERKLSIASLSSTGSGDMYSTNDNSEDDEMRDVGSSTLSKATLTTIDLIMRKIEFNLGYAAYKQCTGSQSSRVQGSTSTRGGSGGRGSSQSGSGSGGGGGKRKARLDDHLPPDDGDEDGANKRRRVSIATTTEDSESVLRFACPFFKHDPNRYRNQRTCPGPGWPTVHRMKEHLYRSHAQPILCPRCYAMFDSESDCSNHARADPPCENSAPQPIEGIDRETLKSLRKRSPAGRLEEDKWRDTYQLLFPGVEMGDIPSPYYATDSPTEESRRFRRDLLNLIRNELLATAEHEHSPIEQRLLRQVAGIIRRCENVLLASFSPLANSRAGNSALLLDPRRRCGLGTVDTVAATENAGSDSSFRTAVFHEAADEALVLGRGRLVDSSMSPRCGAGGSVYVQQEQQHKLLDIDTDADMSDQQIPLAGLGTGMDVNYSADFPSGLFDVDWDNVFPPGLEGGMQGCEEERGVALSTPVWT